MNPDPFIPCYRRLPLRFVRGEGARLFTEDGRPYLDLLSGIAVNALGHAHPRLVEALRDQAGALLHASNLYRHPWGDELATRLAEASGLDLVFFCNSGAEANETALKIARCHHHDLGDPRPGFLALEGGFHGRSLGALSITAKESYRRPFEPLLHGVEWLPPNDQAALAAALRGRRAAALILEPIQGESGVHPLEEGYLQAARDLCDETGTLLIHDEIQCGAGRTGSFLAAEAAGVVPDLVTLAKPIGGGLPLGAVIARAEVGKVLRPGDHGSTFGGNPMACRGGLVFLEELLDHGLLERVAEGGARFREGLEELAERHPSAREVRGRGYMLALELEVPAAPVLDALLGEGVLANAVTETALRFLPPYVLTDDEREEALSILDRALDAADATLHRSDDP